MLATLVNVLRALSLLVLVAAPLSAEVVRIEVTSRTDLAGGQGFGAAGAYEKIAAKSSSPSTPRFQPTASSPTSIGRRETPAARSNSPPTSS